MTTLLQKFKSESGEVHATPSEKAGLLSRTLKTAQIFSDTAVYLQRAYRIDGEIQKLKMDWANDILTRLRVDLERVGEPSRDPSILFVGNHISYLDIPLLMSIVPNLSFVAKKEVQSWPLFGLAAQKINTVFVKREKGRSREQARRAVGEALERGGRVAIFPSGTTRTDESAPWRHGAFEIAKSSGARIQPFRITYQPLRPVAYIDQDFFPFHLFQLSGHESIQAKIEFGPLVTVTNVEVDCQTWNTWARGV